MPIIKNFKLKNEKGFSLVEVLIAILVLSVGITGLLGLMTSNIKDSINSRDAIIASELAQEGIELVRNARDNNFANGRDVFANIASTDGCIDKNTDSNNPSFLCPNEKQLHYESGFYVHSPTAQTLTKFARRITIIDYTGPPAGKFVISTVIWGNSWPQEDCSNCYIGNKCVCTTDILTDWK
jgi:type IV pilus modification protein PilV